MHRRTRHSPLALLIPLAIYGCAAPPQESASDATREQNAAQTPLDPSVIAPSGGVAMDVYRQEVRTSFRLWTMVSSNAQLNLATGEQSISVNLSGTIRFDQSWVAATQPQGWHVVEAIDQDGRIFGGPFRQSDSRGGFAHEQYAQGYLQSYRTLNQPVIVHGTLQGLTERPRVLRKLTVATNVGVIRKVEDRVLDVPALGQAIEIGEGVSAVVESADPDQGIPLRLVVRTDPQRAHDPGRLVVGASLTDAGGGTVDAISLYGQRTPNAITFNFEHRRAPLAEPLRLRLIEATDFGEERVTCVAHDIPVP